MHCDTTTSRTIEAYDSPGPTDEAIRLWQHVFGNRPERLQVFSGFRKSGEKQLLNTAEKYYSPHEWAAALAWASKQNHMGREVYFCAHQLLNDERRKENAATVCALWADVDDGDLAKSPIKPSAIIESSPGRRQAFVRTVPMAPHIGEQLNKRWALAIDADGSGYDLTQLLRVPGCTNHKYLDRPPVKLLSIDDDAKPYSVAELERLLPPLPKPLSAVCLAPTQALSDDDAELLERMGQRSPIFRKLFHQADASNYADEHGHVDPSAVDYGLIRDLLRATGLDADRTERLMRRSALAETRNGTWDDPRVGTNKLRYSIDRAIERWATDEQQNPSTWPQHALSTETAATDEECCGHIQQIIELKQQLADLRAERVWRDQFHRKQKWTAGDKLLGETLVEVHAKAEADGGIERIDEIECIPIVIEANPDTLEKHPERATWTDRTLTGRTALSRSTVKRSLDRLTNETNGVWGLYSKPVRNEDGLERPRLYLVPKASAAATRTAVLEFEPPETEPSKPKTPKLIRCKHHPMARVNEDTTWKCHLCGRHCQPARQRVIDPGDYVPPVQNDELVTGDAESGPAPGRDLWGSIPAVQNDELGIQPSRALPSVETNARQNDELVPRYWPVYDRAPLTVQAVVAGDHCCQDCGAFADRQWGPVVEVGPPGREVWLHAGADAPCKMPAAVVAS